ncbi:hypothetical protein L1281_002501 [Neisseria sp. HSC-16F19]|nr:hypothetical protein [Neisseria sp. HSC-16F19]MCP2041883.1 hypothetical protein [Neisseria sp. HSC-16F19]
MKTIYITTRFGSQVQVATWHKGKLGMQRSGKDGVFSMYPPEKMSLKKALLRVEAVYSWGDFSPVAVAQ